MTTPPAHPDPAPDGGWRRWWAAGVGAVAVAAAIVLPVLTFEGDDAKTAEDPAATSSASEIRTTVGDPSPGRRWLGYRGTEVQVPEDWPLESSPSRPDCIGLGDPARDATAPDHPYVEVAVGMGFSDDVGCLTKDPPADLPAAFGVLPFDFWESHVALADRRPDVPDGSWTYRGWELERRTVGETQVQVLQSPDDAGLADEVMSSAEQVRIDDNGCPVSSDVAATKFQTPAGPGLPDSSWSGIVAVCQYSRGQLYDSGLIGSRRLTGRGARDLLGAIAAAPSGGGPDSPQSCTHDMYGDTAILLRFLPRDQAPGDLAYPEAYVYYDWCFGNGVVTSSGIRQLTAGDCQPLFGGPVRLWEAAGGVFEVCWAG